MATITARLDDWLGADVEAFWRTHGEEPARGLRRVLQEWWTAQHFPAIVFRDGGEGRRAVLRDGPDVWEVVMVARAYDADRPDGDRGPLYAHFAGLVEREAVDQALGYADRFPEEITALLDENARAERALVDAGEG